MAAIVTFLWAATVAGVTFTPIKVDTIGYKGRPAAPSVKVRMVVWPETTRSARSWWPAIVEHFARDTLGTPWQRWIDAALPTTCEPYRASSYVPPEDVFWVYRCQEPAEAGRMEVESFLLAPDSVPTVERTRWSAGRASAPGHARLGETADTLARELATELGAELKLRRRDDPGSRYGWTLVAEFPTRWGQLRLFQGEDQERRDSLIIEHTSRRLEEALARSEQEGSPYEPEESFSVDSLRRVRDRAEVVRALRASAPQLAQALAECPSRATDAGVVAAAIAAALHAPDSDASDVVIWAGHIWGLGLPPDPVDSVAARRVDEAMGPVGGRRVQMPDCWCWQDSLAERLAARAGDNTWTERAFLELMERGWQSQCVLCGYDDRIGTDLFNPVIERGDDFLRHHGNSPIAREVRWRVAEAHETAWSLSKNPPRDDYIAASRYLLDAPGHLRLAIEFYESLLPTEPPGLRRAAVANRLARLKLDVDTGFRRYWCMWD